MKYPKHPLHSAIKLTLGSSLLAISAASLAQPGTGADTEIPVIRVTALAINEDANLIVAPFSIIEEKHLFQAGGTLGELLSGIPGVHADTFGAGSSRPVIRGQTSPRVRILSDSAGILDASDVSPDHAISADPLLAQRIEVLRGPATLLYGGAAIGGVVNVLDNKIPTALPEGMENFIALRGNTVADERAGAVSVTGQASDRIVLHMEGSLRDTEDYKAPDFDESRVDGTFSESNNAAVGGSWIGDNGFIGMAYSYRSEEYGLPGHSEEYEECHPHGSTLDCGNHEEDDDHHDGEHGDDHGVPLVDLRSQRYDLRAEYNQPFTGIDKIRMRVSHTDYRHHEIEEDEISTTFRNRGVEGRVDINHATIAGWQGVFGIQVGDTTFSSLGSETFIPKTDSRMFGVFLVEHYEFNEQWHLELGARYENQRHRPVNDARNRPAYDKSATSLSGALIWAFSEEHTLALNLANAQRAPQPQELYARGVHLATNTYECGLAPHPLTCGGLANNQGISLETSRNADITLRRHVADLTYTLNAFYNDVDNYIYARTLDQFEDFRLIKYTQQDARFVGAEAEISYQFEAGAAATLFGDYVRAKLRSGGNLPRIPSSRVGARLNTPLGGADTEIEFYRVSKQDDIAAYETSTPGYNMLNATVSYDLSGDERYSVFLRGSNLLNNEIRNHSSFLADVIPLPGRNLSAGFRFRF